MLAWYMPWLRVRVHLSQVMSSIETDERIETVLGMGASFDQSSPCAKGTLGISKNKGTSATLSHTLVLENFAERT